MGLELRRQLAKRQAAKRERLPEVLGDEEPKRNHEFNQRLVKQLLDLVSINLGQEMPIARLQSFYAKLLLNAVLRHNLSLRQEFYQRLTALDVCTEAVKPD